MTTTYDLILNDCDQLIYTCMHLPETVSATDVRRKLEFAFVHQSWQMILQYFDKMFDYLHKTNNECLSIFCTMRRTSLGENVIHTNVLLKLISCSMFLQTLHSTRTKKHNMWIKRRMCKIIRNILKMFSVEDCSTFSLQSCPFMKIVTLVSFTSEKFHVRSNM